MRYEIAVDKARGALALYDEDGFLDNNDLQRVMPLVRAHLAFLDDPVAWLREQGAVTQICKPHLEGNRIYTDPGEPWVCTSAEKYGGDCEWVDAALAPTGEAQ